jgi:hypothetical protein
MKLVLPAERPVVVQARGVPRPSKLRFPALVICFTVAAILLQWLAGCYQAEPNGYPDEPAHLLTGLMVRDYAVSGFKQGPLGFAENYYLHYPKVAFGIWPPLFHFVEGAWFLVFPPSLAAAYALQALIIGLLAATLVLTVVKRFESIVLGVAAGLGFVAMPVVQLWTGMLMADNLMAVFSFLAMLQFAEYAETGRWRNALWFGCLLGLGVTTKSNGAAMGAMPILTLLLLRRYRGLFAPQMFAAAGLSLAIAVPWQLLVIRLWTGTASPIDYSWPVAWELFVWHVKMYVSAPGPAITILAAIGLAQRVILPHRPQPFWASAAGMVAAFFLSGLAPLPAEHRYHIAAMAGIVLFAAAGVHGIASRLTIRRALPQKIAAVTAVAALLVVFSAHIPARETYGAVEAGRALASDPALADSVIMVSSESAGEGTLIAEMALNERRPGHFILRASKMLGRSRWEMDQYELLYSTPESMQSYMESIPVNILVFDTTPGPITIPHHKILRDVLARYPEKWELVQSYPSSGPNGKGGRFLVYRLAASAMPPPDRRVGFQVDMRYTTGGTLERKPQH